MSLKKRILFYIIGIQRYIFKRKFISIFSGPLKGYLWSTAYNYEYITGDYEEEDIMDFFCSWFKPDSVFYDLGANVGYYSFIANKYIASGSIYSFEPMPVNLNVFREHLRLNKNKISKQNIELLPYAVSDREKEVIFSNEDELQDGNTYLNSPLHKNSTKDFKVKCYSIDALLEQGNKKPDVIKIDVEGAEYDVLRGAEKTLVKYKPNILLATHDCHVAGVQKLCVDFLENLGYELKPLNNYNKTIPGLDDYIAIHKESITR